VSIPNLVHAVEWIRVTVATVGTRQAGDTESSGDADYNTGDAVVRCAIELDRLL